MLKLALVIVVLMSTLVSAECNFTGRVHLEKSDLANFTQDQVACGLQQMMGGMDILVILVVIFLVALLIYSLWRRK